MKTTPSTVVRTNLFSKTNNTFSNVARNTSCSRGWLRLVVQLLFGAITVASFVLIIHMTFQRNTQRNVPCKTVNCRITCSGTHYTEEDISAAMMEADPNCKVQVTLIDFESGILPEFWLDNFPYYIDTLRILGGNLHEISNNAFMSQSAANMKSLILENVTLLSWTSDTFIGLPDLKFLRLRNCNFRNIGHGALRAVDNTIKTLTISGCGAWDPALITGTAANSFPKLTVVNFSFNNFGSILKASSFTGIHNCQDLYINSCGITSIEKGAFDSLTKLTMLFLNDNFLMTLAPGLFHNIIMQSEFTPRINLQNNLWHCDCSQSEMMLLSSKGILLVDPVCYYPSSFSGKSVSSLEEFCSNVTKNRSTTSYRNTAVNIDYQIPNKCYYGTDFLEDLQLRIISPSPFFTCPNINFKKLENIRRPSQNKISENFSNASASWLRPKFFVSHDSFSMMQISSESNNSHKYGLIWFQSECPNEAYCFSALPYVLRLYHVNPDVQYTFCPLQMSISRVEVENCLYYGVTDTAKTVYHSHSRPLLYVATGTLCLFFGAIIVYSIIRMNPCLLKGSKRLLFVKHRTVDALVLPPKVPLRASLSQESNEPNNKIYTVSDDRKLLCPCNLVRSNSVRSDKSSTPTYISAMQPTEAQLAEWRLRHHFDNNPSITSVNSDTTYYLFCEDNSGNYVSHTYVSYENFK